MKNLVGSAHPTGIVSAMDQINRKTRSFFVFTFMVFTNFMVKLN